MPRNKHWCPNGCGEKAVRAIYNKNIKKIYCCRACQEYFSKKQLMAID
jgi:hypothetical protein